MCQNVRNSRSFPKKNCSNFFLGSWEAGKETYKKLLLNLSERSCNLWNLFWKTTGSKVFFGYFELKDVQQLSKKWQTSEKVNVLWNFFKNLQQIFLGTRRFLFPDEKRKLFRSVFGKSDIPLKNFWKKWPNCSPGYVERRYGNTSNDCFAHGKKRVFCFFQ